MNARSRPLMEPMEMRRLLDATAFIADADELESIAAVWRQPSIHRLHGPANLAFAGGRLYDIGVFFERTLPLDHYEARIAWGDGSTSAGSLRAVGEKGAYIEAAHDYAQPGRYTLVVHVQATDGASASYTQTVLPFAGAMALVWDSVYAFHDEGGMQASLLIKLEPVLIRDADEIVATIDWGDGAVTTAERGYNWLDDGEPFSGRHTYRDAGTYTVTFTATAPDQDGVMRQLVVSRELTVSTPQANPIIGLFGERFIASSAMAQRADDFTARMLDWSSAVAELDELI